MSGSAKLGRGLDSLLKTDVAALGMAEGEHVKKLSLDQLNPDPEQPRKHFDSAALSELASSIKRHGVLQPLIVTSGPKGYTIVAGERRWRAAGLAGLKEVPVLVRTTAELEKLEISLIENVQRVDLSPLEQALSIQRLHEQFSLSFEEIAKRLGKATTTVNNIVRLLGLPEPAAKALDAHDISEGHARAVLSLKGNEDAQQHLLDEILSKNLSVRKAEELARALKQKQGQVRAAPAKAVLRDHPGLPALSKHLGAKASVRRTARGGRLEIHFKDDTELSSLIDRIKKS